MKQRNNLRLTSVRFRLPKELFVSSFAGRIKTINRTLFSLVILWLTVTTVQATDQTGIAFFEQNIRPVLVANCYECHSAGAKALKGNLYLDSKAGWEKGGDSGEPAIVPGKPEESLLIRTVQHSETGLEMPPDKPQLLAAAIADLVTWVKMGAPDPRDGVQIEAKRGDKSWWSLQPLAKQVSFDNIDDFIIAKLTEKNLTLNPPAGPRELIRRITYDLTGLPPSHEEVDRFTLAYQVNRQQAVETLVDQLLESPRYGERWGRHWLDVIRFGESNGFERNFVIDDLWPFRDYVIKSLNDDKPFNQFITEHLAGDVIGKDNPQVEVGSAFLVAGPYDDVGNQDAVAQKNIRAATLDDLITATSGAFLGLTINCARCHHHKFDPIPTEDYYRLRAAFEGIQHGRRVVATREQHEAFAEATKPLNAELKSLEAEREASERQIDELAKAAIAEQKATRPKIDHLGTEETFDPVEAKVLKFVVKSFTDAHDSKPSRSGKLTEFQVWSVDERNVALAENGTIAEGAKSATADDFPEAYGPQYCIDGQRGEAWFIGTPPVLTLTFKKPEKINRISFMNTRGDRDTDDTKVRGATPCEYEVQISTDGKIWKTVATDEGREPWTPQHAAAKARRSIVDSDMQRKLDELNSRITAVKEKLKLVPVLPQMWVGTHSKSMEKTAVHIGGDPMKPGEPVVPASLSVLDRSMPAYALKEDADEGERRLALAKWITSNENPLTPRVLANRVWQHHFGTGIVDTPSDFGFLGSQPTHPELLDYLATQLIAHDWRLKPLHRKILLSKVYQQSAAYRDEYAKVDKYARLLWRFPPRRLSAEEIRDTMLCVAGKLQLEPMGGPGFRLYKFSQNNVCTYFPLDVHGPDTYRRGVYHQNARASVVDVLNDFDFPDIAFAAPKRANTTTPLQALTLLNHRFTLDMADALAERIGGDDSIRKAYHFVLQREATPKEREAATKLIASHGVPAFCRALLNSNELIYLD